ncbi:MAG: RsmB/NOP family class I SAM-dependent RNA methyltransferase [Chitinophagaceae bacterium]|nr:RsmB/NOP family class I SAM-dependent RNA methyltransferase [Oligoflexus sp.]
MHELLQSPRTPHLLRIWTDLCREKEMPQLDRWLVLRMKQDKRFGSKDRRWYSEGVFSAIRAALPYMEHLEGRPLDPRESWDILRAIEPETFFKGLAAYAESPDRDDLTRGGLSSWFRPSLARRIELSHWDDGQTKDFLKAQNTRAPLWLRLNRPAHKAKIEKKLEELQVAYSWRGEGLKIETEKNLSQTPILEEGWAEVQDYGSQILGDKIPVSGAVTVWDCCAGGGGKSLQLAAKHPKAQIYSSDVRSYKSTEVSKRALRARLPNITPIPWNGSAQLELPRAVGKGFDIIVVDAPCSGSGTWRRSPDGRYRTTHQSLNDLQKLQLSIVEKVLPFLKPGGQLVYATCSWFPEENEDVTALMRETLNLTLEEESICGLPVEDSDTLFFSLMRKGR